MLKPKFVAGGLFCLALCYHANAQVAPGSVQSVTVSSNNYTITVAPLEGADVLTLLRATTAGGSYSTVTPGAGSVGYRLIHNNAATQGYYKSQITTLSSNAVLTAIALNRLAYGPTPDEIERIMGAGYLTNSSVPLGIGPNAWIAEQLAPSATDPGTTNNTNIAYVESRFAPDFNTVVLTNETSGAGTAGLAELRQWAILRGVNAKYQLLEILLQFFDNHMTTQWQKDNDFFAGPYNGVANIAGRLAANLEVQEYQRWRTALLNPACTFSNLLTISAESPAMIVYMDTTTSRGDGTQVPNENYAREFRELFSMGVDNGYEQDDITEDSYNWTGWNLRFVDVSNAFNRFAGDAALPNPGGISNNVGVWVFNYRSDHHPANSGASITNKFYGVRRIYFDRDTNHNATTPKIVPARFGAPWTTKTYGTNSTPGDYSIVITNRTGTNGIQDAYKMIAHQSTLPFVYEYTCMKLCRTFVHDDFALGYDFTDPNLSDEGKLVKSAMLAMENSGGKIWPAVSNIVTSALFRASYAQKVKTPLEYSISAIRALRGSTNGVTGPGKFAADTDGLSIANAGTYPMERMGAMRIFDRDAPDGWPEYGSAWISAGTLAERIRFIQTYLMTTGDTNKNDGISGGNKNVADPVGLIKSRLAAGDQGNANVVADLFLKMLYPGEGAVNLAQYKDAAVRFLQSDQFGDVQTSTTFSTEASNSTAPGSEYDTRVRGMVSLLMTLQRFNEQ
ncbi:MAG TPA: DUF1800 family protein [Verrucomicrobiae bacterium]|jgi:uncharacterized protein (DUF1800 family)